jgi:hypothetical protein
MKVGKKEQPFIDYKTANIMARMFDFITSANYERKKIAQELDLAINALQSVRKALEPLVDPDDNIGHLTPLGWTNNIASLRADAWEIGLSHKLFKKLADKDFRNRFVLGFNPPVLEAEIKDIYEDKKVIAKKTGTKTTRKGQV